MKIIISMCPTGTNHAYHTNGGRWYKDKKVKNWEEECLLELKGKTVLVNKAWPEIWFYFGNKRKNDIDGRLKAVLDLMQKAGLVKDDSEIMDATLHKRFDKENPRIEIEL
jgi:crossover junction endodeoxyribonuclease RusA